MQALVYGKVPPQAKNMEEAVLGAIMLERGAMDIVSEILPVEAFYVDAHQKIYAAAQRLAAKSAPIDINMMVEELRSAGELELVGGPFYVTRLTNTVVSAANIEAHARIILQKFMARELIRIGGEMVNSAYEDTTDVFDLLNQAESDIFSISQNHVHADYVSISTAMMEVQKDVEMLQMNDSEITGIPSGFKEIDDVTHGWQDTDLIITAARPSVGKTAFALNLARAAAAAGYPAGIFSLEMNRKQIGKRLAAAESGIDLNKIMTGKMSEQEMSRFMKDGVFKVGSSKIYIDDRADMTIFNIRSKARKMVNKHGVRVIIIDYMQLITGDGKSGNREQEISKISRQLKQLAKDLGIPIIALSQLSRDADNEEPQLRHLRESGAIEQDADLVFLLWKAFKADIEKNPNLAFIRYWKLAKHRNGGLDEGAIPFDGRIQKFSSATASPQFPAPSGGRLIPVNIHRHDPGSYQDEEAPF